MLSNLKKEKTSKPLRFIEKCNEYKCIYIPKDKKTKDLIKIFPKADSNEDGHIPSKYLQILEISGFKTEVDK